MARCTAIFATCLLGLLGLLAGSVGTPAAQAAVAQAPVVGECYDLSEARIAAGSQAGAAALGTEGYWADTEPVPCAEAHTFEVTEVGPLPADVDAFAFAERQCGSLDVWNAVGVNRPRAGIVRWPLRIESRSYALRLPLPGYVCGAVATGGRVGGRLSSATDPGVSILRLSSPIERLTDEQRAQLRYCLAATPAGRPAQAAPAPCSTRPRWQVASWVLWTAFYDAFPGRQALRERARQVCGKATVVSVPTAAQWAAGLPTTWCYRYVTD